MITERELLEHALIGYEKRREQIDAEIELVRQRVNSARSSTDVLTGVLRRHSVPGPATESRGGQRGHQPSAEETMGESPAREGEGGGRGMNPEQLKPGAGCNMSLSVPNRSDFRKRVVAKAVRDLRASIGWSQSRLARALDGTSASISRWESGQLLPYPANCRRLRALASRHGRDDIAFVFGLSDDIWALVQNEEQWRRISSAREAWAERPEVFPDVAAQENQDWRSGSKPPPNRTDG